jgi:prolyl-tRNA editing enzyme YbaK/EbsC (Cys-tRNA(Pro) deacylase)
MSQSGSVERVRAALVGAGHDDTIAVFAEGTRTAAEAAASVGCEVAQIAKSIVFRAGERAVVVIASGVNRADADWVRGVTGFAIGGVAPVGHLVPPLVVLDRDLLALDPVWAAAGSPVHVFRTSADWLTRLTGAVVADVKWGPGD